MRKNSIRLLVPIGGVALLCALFTWSRYGGQPTVDEEARETAATWDIWLPKVGRAVRYSLEVEFNPDLPRFDVIEVSGTRVRLREGLCSEGEVGSWVDWRTVRSWEDVGLALGDDRYLGLPMYPDY